MILSESEKNRIKGLYGLVNESDATAPPPNESVLVAKKNPFKDNNVMDMISKDGRFIRYDKDLVDGDTFLVYDNDNLQQYFQKISDDFFNRNFLGKTIRYNVGDTDYTKKIEVKNKRNVYVNSILPSTLYGISELGFRYPSIYYDFRKDDIIGYPSDGLGSKKYEVSDETKNKLLQIFRGNKDKFLMSNVPDEYWELREVKREKTDF